jgi:hypothetical protein
LVEKALSPEADHVAAHGEGGGDLVVALAFGGEEDDPGPEHLKVRQRILPRSVFQEGPLLGREVNDEWALSRHNIPSLLRGIIAENEDKVNQNMLPYLGE